MGRGRRHHVSVSDDDRWKDATSWHDREGRTIQVVGLDSVAGTAFARLSRGSDMTMTLGDVVDLIMKSLARKNGNVSFEAKELCKLGAVWVLPFENQEHPQNPPKWCRECCLQYPVEAESTVRLHSRPARFPSSKNVAVIHDDKELGFLVLNKPGGCPSHATVDNGVENALATIQRHYTYASLPQRLDIETSGLLLVSTKKRFATYISRLLEKKTADCSEESNSAATTSDMAITKKYRCLVIVAKDGMEGYKKLQHFHSTGQILTHYLDPQSSAPKHFQHSVPANTRNKWQRCELRLTGLSQLYSIQSSNHPIEDAACRTLATALCGDRPLPNAASIVQVEVELLTGRTHQIRGQLSAMGTPIVGDPLYGGGDQSVLQNSSDRDSNRMALQCYALQFPQPTTSDGHKSWQTSNSQCRFFLELAWWTEHLQAYEKQKH